MKPGQQQIQDNPQTPAVAPSEDGGGKIVYGRNGVPIHVRGGSRTTGGGYRTYEIHQRMRVGESTAKVKPNAMLTREYLEDPYPTLAILRENYPCYRDWIGNSYWISRYDEVTSIFADDANFETRPKLWFYGREDFGRDFGQALPVLVAHAERTDAHAAAVAESILGEMAGDGSGDLAVAFAARYAMEMLARVIDLPAADFDFFVDRYWKMQQGCGWSPKAEQAGLDAMNELVSYFEPLLEQRRADPGDDLISAIAGLETETGPTTAQDVVVTLLERDHETLHGALANMWYLLLTHPEQLELLREDDRLVKYAYQETVRHSTPVLQAKRFARQEVERFGRLLPEGALLICSAAAANRDPRVFKDPDRFDVNRKDLCRREPRGQYRADGLPTGITFGLGQPTKHPAVPEDRPRSLYAITRDTAVTASKCAMAMLPGLRLADGAKPGLRALRVGDMHTCWQLPATWRQ